MRFLRLGHQFWQRVKVFVITFAIALCAPTILAQKVTYFHNDASGTPMVATDSAGNLVWKENYRPYGDKLNNQPSSSGNKIGFAGKPYDGNTGLSYMGARYYDPMLGRFTGVDAAPPDPENVHSLNRYAYANNNPYRYVDPDGNSPLDVVFLAWDLGKLGLAVYSGNPAAIADASVDVGLSMVGVVSPFPGAGQAMKAARAAEHGIQAVKAAEHTAQAVTAAVATKSVHKNSLSYVGETHVYRIKGPDGATHKIGESARGLNAEGASIRAEQQARRLQRRTGDVYETDVRKTFPDKKSAREYETRLIERYRSMYGEDKLPGNLTNR